MRRHHHLSISALLLFALGCDPLNQDLATDMAAFAEGVAGGPASTRDHAPRLPMEGDHRAFAEGWVRAWNAPSEAERLELLSHITVEGFRYDSPRASAVGMVNMSDLMAESHQRQPGRRIVPLPYGLQIARNVGHGAWQAIDGNGQVVQTGVELFEFESDGRLLRVTSHPERVQTREPTGAYALLEQALSAEGPSTQLMQDAFTEDAHITDGPFDQKGRAGVLDYLLHRRDLLGSHGARATELRHFGEVGGQGRLRMELLAAEGGVLVELTLYVRLDSTGRVQRLVGFVSDPLGSD